eukprot:TRINITY_DN14115_c0_g1_i1.p1 TRINITY_DN14115_c0_g1~~TRINITY_DN14115_c0_g1_i1.p1  ORF type:complete len:124 (-),score=0.30 TRINITY_DN14115_c0_g1_i1:425-796(-)
MLIWQVEPNALLNSRPYLPYKPECSSSTSPENHTFADCNAKKCTNSLELSHCFYAEDRFMLTKMNALEQLLDGICELILNMELHIQRRQDDSPRQHSQHLQLPHTSLPPRYQVMVRFKPPKLA